MSTVKLPPLKIQDSTRVRVSASGEPLWIDFDHPLIKRATLLRKQGRKQEAEMCLFSYFKQYTDS
ncbi:hypothetical protein DB346_11350 [Verrucomicrobia bacterium LW23]|nr:hypothetical protein DB346_11350 [Verrucomicrobia bacterium LW23]